MVWFFSTMVTFSIVCPAFNAYRIPTKVPPLQRSNQCLMTLGMGTMLRSVKHFMGMTGVVMASNEAWWTLTCPDSFVVVCLFMGASSL